MLFRYHLIPSLPPLAWCARVNPPSDAVAVFHGTRVETHPRGFIEGAWDGAFASLDFTAATIVAGTGGVLERDRVRFSASTDQLGPLFSIAKAGSIYVSNSPAFAMIAAGEEPDAIYPFYPYDLLRIYRQGLYCPDGRLTLHSRNALHVHFTTIITIDARGSVGFESHRLCEPPRDYRSYKELLLKGVGRVLENGADAARRRTYAPLAAFSRGYDSTAGAVLARSGGCTEAFTFIDDRSGDPNRDNGAGNAQYLGMRCEEYGRWQYLESENCPEAEFGYGPTSSNAPIAVVEDQLSGRLLIVGENGDPIWDPKRAKVFQQLAKPWLRFTLGVSAIEFRLRVGYHVFAPAAIAIRHNRAIHDIATSEEMRPWSVGGNYDRPLPRRIVEEAGLPRERFGMRKAASSHSHLTDASRFSKNGLNRYRDFVRERHAGIPWHIRQYWRSCAGLRHRLWNAVGDERRRYVRSTPLQRRFPFILNAIPIPIPWDFMFTFQWTVASMRSRYTVAAQQPGPQQV